MTLNLTLEMSATERLSDEKSLNAWVKKRGIEKHSCRVYEPLDARDHAAGVPKSLGNIVLHIKG
jgi:hypothetical protein